MYPYPANVGEFQGITVEDYGGLGGSGGDGRTAGEDELAELGEVPAEARGHLHLEAGAGGIHPEPQEGMGRAQGPGQVHRNLRKVDAKLPDPVVPGGSGRRAELRADRGVRVPEAGPSVRSQVELLPEFLRLVRGRGEVHVPVRGDAPVPVHVEGEPEVVSGAGVVPRVIHHVQGQVQEAGVVLGQEPPPVEAELSGIFPPSTGQGGVEIDGRIRPGAPEEEVEGEGWEGEMR